MLNALRKHARILYQYGRIGVIRKSQFRFEFFSQVIMDTFWYSSHILVFEVLFSHADVIAGWSKEEIRVFLGFLFVSDAFMMMWLGQAWHFGKDLKDGNLDPIRIRPASAIVLYFFRSFSLEACFNMAIAASFLTYALWAAGVSPSLYVGSMLVWALILTWWVQVILRVFFTITEFFFLNSDLGHFLREFFGAVEDRPLDIFAQRIKSFFLWVIPVGAMAQVPAAMVLGKQGPLFALAMSAWLTVMGFATFWAWKRSFRRYESAMG